MTQTLDEVVRLLESRFSVVADGIPSAISNTGELYVTLTSGGIKQEREFGGFASSPEMAILSWAHEVAEYAMGRGSKLYWRKRPEMDEGQMFRDRRFELGTRGAKGFTPVKVYTVYSRLLVTDAPEISADVAA